MLLAPLVDDVFIVREFFTLVNNLAFCRVIAWFLGRLGINLGVRLGVFCPCAAIGEMRFLGHLGY
jgi:hypothetical protein